MWAGVADKREQPKIALENSQNDSKRINWLNWLKIHKIMTAIVVVGQNIPMAISNSFYIVLCPILAPITKFKTKFLRFLICTKFYKKNGSNFSNVLKEKMENLVSH